MRRGNTFQHTRRDLNERMYGKVAKKCTHESGNSRTCSCLGCDNLVMPGVFCAVVDEGYRLIEKVMQP